MPWPVHPTGFFGAQGDQDTYKIERSLRFNSADSAYLSRTPASAGNTQKFTYSAWVKIASTATSQYITLLAAGTGAQTNTGNDSLQLRGNGTGLQIGLLGQGGTGGNYAQFSAYHRDPSSWQHVIVSVDTTQATQANRCRAYFNGVEETSAVNNTFGSAYNFTYLNTTAAHLIGRGNEVGGPYHTDAYLTEINFIDGQALTPSSFGETDAITGRWKAKAYSGTYGTNGFYLKFADNSGTTATTLGKDSSGNGNNWTPNNFSVTAGVGNDSLLDSPTNSGDSGNYCTLNPLKTNSTFTLSNGNLDFSATSSASNSLYVISSVGISSGKWYWEVTPSDIGAGPNIFVGIRLSSASTTSGSSGVFDSGYGYGAGGNKRDGTGDASYGASYANNDVVGIALDLDAGTIVFYKNGVSQGTAFSGLSGTFEPAINLNVSGVSRTIAGFCNFGQRPFAYTAPTGFKALCTTNLPTPTIRKPSSYMDVVAYTGTGASNSISSLGFSPDLVWIKNRGGATSHAIYDTTRGAQNQLSSDTTGDAVTSSSGLTAFGANGFTIGTSSLVNTSGTQYVAWAWDEAAIAGMDIVSYTGNGANRTISHNLGVAPKMLVVKARTTAGADQGWPTWHTSIANTTYLQLNSTSATATGTDYLNSSSPTSSVFSVGTNAAVNANNDTYIAYLFAEVEGFSKFGSYTGNGSADGPFVWCGFRPRYWIIKRTDSSGGWWTWDTARNLFNPANSIFRANNANAEDTDTLNYNIDFLSNGFKVRATSFTADGGMNVSGATYIFAAFAESAYKYARAR